MKNLKSNSKKHPKQNSKQNPTYYLNQKGFSLVGVMVASILGLIVFSGITTMQVTTMKSLGRAEDRLQATQLHKHIEHSMNQEKPEDSNCPDSSPCKNPCTNTLEGLNINNTEISFNEIKTAYDETKYPEDTTSDPQLPKGERTLFSLNHSSSDFKEVKIHKMNFSGNPDDKTGQVKIYYEYGGFKSPKVQTISVKITDTNTGTPETVKTCEIEAGGGGGEADCYKVTEDGHTIVGCDEDGNTTGASAPNDSTIFGYEAGRKSTGNDNLFLGWRTGFNNTTGSKNTFVGKVAGAENIDGERNTFIGYHAGIENIDGNDNTFVGSEAGWGNETGNYNTFIGRRTGYTLDYYDHNTFIGYHAGHSKTEGEKNTFVGSETGKSATEGDQNTFIGYRAGHLTKSSSNTFVGYNVAGGTTEELTGHINTFVGAGAGFVNTTGAGNVFVGGSAGRDNTTGKFNVFIGQQAGEDAITGRENIYIGFKAQLQATKSNQLQIGKWIKGEIETETTGTGDSAVSTDKQKTLTLLSSTAGDKMSDAGVVVEGNLEVKGNLTCNGSPCGSSGGLTKKTLYSSTSGSGGTGTSFTLSESIKNFDLISIRAKDTSNDDMAVQFVDPQDITVSNADNGTNVVGLFADNATTDNHRIFIQFTTNTSVYVTFARNHKIYKVIGWKWGDTPATITASSRVYKQNITPFEDYESSLGVIMDTPLFNYQYKKNYIFYDTEVGHTRMGVISEELPVGLQIKEKGKPSVPDWVSVYGTLWAGIKALAKKVFEVQRDLASKISKEDIKDLKEFKELKEDNKELKEDNKKLKEEVDLLKQEIEEIKKKIVKENS